MRNQIQCPQPSQCLCLCSSGDRKGPRSHLDSDDTFAGAEPPAGSAAPCGKEDTPRGFFSCPWHHDGPREGPWTQRNGRIRCLLTMEGEPGPNIVTPCYPSSTGTQGSEWSWHSIGEEKADHPWTYKGHELATVEDGSVTQRRLQERIY